MSLKDFSSKALEANMAQTKIENIFIPEEQAWFGELSKEKWGIYKRTQAFLREYNHAFRNEDEVIESLHTICLNDLWFYQSTHEPARALSVLVGIFEELFQNVKGLKQKDLLVKNLVKFVDRLASLDAYPLSVVKRCLELIEKDLEHSEQIYIQNSRYFKTYFDKVAQNDYFFDLIERITRKVLNKTIDFWASTTNIESWFQVKSHLFVKMDEETLSMIGKPFYDELREALNCAKTWQDFQGLMYFNDISNYYRGFTDKFESHLETIYYLYYLLRLPGMAQIKTHLLYDINRNLRHVFKELDEGDVRQFIDVIATEFKQLKDTQSSTVIDCVVTMGKEIILTENKEHMDFFITRIVSIGFESPGKHSLNKNWQTNVSPNHVKNIRAWLELIMTAPLHMRDLLAALIVNLKWGGIFISDTDLFQRDVTKLLNADITPVYREIKQLAKIFPVYFRDIGAEGKLRDYSTAMDELSMRKDKLIHFLRKQIHTESNNTHIHLTKRIIAYWYEGDEELLSGLLPDDVERWLSDNPYWFEGVHKIMVDLCTLTNRKPPEILDLGIDVIKSALESIESNNTRDVKRVLYIFEVYYLVLEKYALASENIVQMVADNHQISKPYIEILNQQLAQGENRKAIRTIYCIMDELKSIVLDPNKTEGYENIYYKRHVAVGIPSMYGQYIEPKFEALGLIYRLEKTVSKLFEKALRGVNLNYITAKTWRHIWEILDMFKTGLGLDGIVNEGFNSRLNMLKFAMTSPSFSLDQFMNIFQFMAKDIKQIIDEYFIDVYERPLKLILPALDQENYLIEAEKFYRDNLYTAFLVQDLDHFISEVIGTLDHLIDNYSKELIQNMMTYDPDIVISGLHETTDNMDNPVFLGAKAFFLKRLKTLNYPVPSGFVLTTEVFRHNDVIQNHPSIKSELEQLIRLNLKKIEGLTGKKYGSLENPLLLSVRSGSSISLPGAMQTFLNVGLNDEIAEAFSAVSGCGWAAWDCYRRFLQSWGMSAGIERDVFDHIMSQFKKKYDIQLKAAFTVDQMKEVALSYKDAINHRGVYIEFDPFKQLLQAIYSVIQSWHSNSANAYRTHLNIANEWGTAVLVQEMILGNKSQLSGTGVVFTNSPFNDLSGIQLFGDFVPCSQGEDVVSGLVNTFPINEKQRLDQKEPADFSLELKFPRIYDQLKSYASQLVDAHGFVHQEIEFTFDENAPERLFLLQTRNQKLKKKKALVNHEELKESKRVIARGIGVNSGIITGVLAFDEADVALLKERHPDSSILLARPYTVPDDIPLIFKVDGVITAKGGITSHAAVTAASLGKVCIVNCKMLVIDDFLKTGNFNGEMLRAGDFIAMDGYTGNIFKVD